MIMAQAGLIAALFSALLSLGDSRIISDSPVAVGPKDLSVDACSECRALLLRSQNMISRPQTKTLVYGGLRSLCQSRPPPQASRCHSQVDKHLAEALLQPQSGAEQLGPVCSLCVLTIKKLEDLLPKNMTEDAIRALLAEVCSLMPQSYKDQCDEFIEKYGEEIVDFLLSSAAPSTICTLLHLCLFNSTPAPSTVFPSDCDSCRTLSVLSRLGLGLTQDVNQSESRTSTFLQSVCALHPRAIPKCEAFTRVYGSQLLRVLEAQQGGPDACERAALCAPQRKVSLIGNKRCTWGPSYWCRDMKTAQECRNQAFCKKFVWK